MFLLWDGIVWLTEIHIQVFGQHLTWENEPLWRRCKTLLKACMNINLPNVVGAIDGSHVRNKGTEHRTLSSVTLRAQAPAVRWPSCLWACMGISTTALRNKKIAHLTSTVHRLSSDRLLLWKEPILASYSFLGLLHKRSPRFPEASAACGWILLSVTTSGPNFSCEIVILLNKSRGEITSLYGNIYDRFWE